jgi:hypothetical protein
MRRGGAPLSRPEPLGPATDDVPPGGEITSGNDADDDQGTGS